MESKNLLCDIPDKLMALLRCPHCRVELSLEWPHLDCRRCQQQYPIRFGIPDLRTMDPSAVGYADFEEDLELAQELADVYDRLDYEALIHFRLRHTPEVSQALELVEHYVRHRLGGWSGATALAVHLQKQTAIWGCDRMTNGIGLDIGCGSGGGLGALVEVCSSAIGVDIVLAELLTARKFLDTYAPGHDVLLVAGTAEALPLPDNTFSVVIARDVIEHVEDRERFLSEAYRVQAFNSLFSFNTASRFTWTEPHTLLKGIGFLPRSLQSPYVRWRRGRGYSIHLPSLGELQRLLRQTWPGSKWEIVCRQRVDPQERPATWKGWLVRHIPGLARLINGLYAQVSSFEVIGFKSA